MTSSSHDHIEDQADAIMVTADTFLVGALAGSADAKTRQESNMVAERGPDDPWCKPQADPWSRAGGGRGTGGSGGGNVNAGPDTSLVSMAAALQRVEDVVSRLLDASLIDGRTIDKMLERKMNFANIVTSKPLKHSVDDDIDDEEANISLEEAAQHKRWIRGTLTKYMPDKAYGFAKAAGGTVFTHLSAISGTVDGLMGQSIRMKVLADTSRGPNMYKAVEVLRESQYLEMIAKENATKAAASALVAAEESRKRAEAAKIAAESVELASLRSQCTFSMSPPGF